MDANFKALRLDQISKSVDPCRPIGDVIRPGFGWLRAIREGLDLTLREVASRLGVTAPAVRSLEKAEAEDRITLASLRRVAGALGCEVVYLLVPREGSFERLADGEARRQIAADIEATEHSMALEAQGSYDVADQVARAARRKTRGLP